MVFMFDVFVFAGIGLLSGVTFGTVINFGRPERAAVRDPLWRLVAWGVVGSVIGGLLALAFRFPIFYTPV